MEYGGEVILRRLQYSESKHSSKEPLTLPKCQNFVKKKSESTYSVGRFRLNLDGLLLQVSEFDLHALLDDP